MVNILMNGFFYFNMSKHTLVVYQWDFMVIASSACLALTQLVSLGHNGEQQLGVTTTVLLETKCVRLLKTASNTRGGEIGNMGLHDDE